MVGTRLEALDAAETRTDRTDVTRFQTGIVVDAHVHPADYLPGFAATAWRWFTRHTVPPQFSFDQLPSTGVDVAVANAVGDRVVTAWWGRPPWRAVHEQLRRIRAQAEDAHVVVAMSARQVLQAFESHRPAVVLGLEGGDGIGMNLDRVNQLFEWGVRILVPVHLRDNQIGTTCLPWAGYIGPFSLPRKRPRGLTAFGIQVIERMNSLGMMIDVSHADTATLHDVVKLTQQPIIASHTGARRVEEFERFLQDDEILAVAGTGGLVGLWPYRYRGHGTIDVNALMRHARYIADLVGSAHLCVGSDINGVPGVMAGYRGERDVRLIAEHLRASGFDHSEIESIMGGNFMRVFEQVLPG